MAGWYFSWMNSGCDEDYPFILFKLVRALVVIK
jgi:hypothetical protein